jgi:NTE family protein
MTKGLCLSGGGAHGAFQVGVIKRLAELGHRWDFVVGVSVGAINALQMAMCPKDKQLEGARDLEQFWYAIKGNETIYHDWTIPIIEGLFGRGGMYDTEPLKNLLTHYYDPKKMAAGIPMRVGACNLRTGQVEFGHEHSLDVVAWVLASASYPGAFPPVWIGGDAYTDGGVRHTAPIEEAIRMGADDIDIVLCDPQTGEDNPWDQGDAGNAALVGIRAAGIMSNEVFVTDQDVLKQFKGKHRIYSPYAPWSLNSLTFDPRAIRHMIDVGYGIP